MRTPAQTATGSGARHFDVRRGGMTAPAPISRSRSGASASSGPSWATGRPPEVTTVRSPDPARRTASVSAIADAAQIGSLAIASSTTPRCVPSMAKANNALVSNTTVIAPQSRLYVILGAWVAKNHTQTRIHPRNSRRTWSMRTPAQTATGAGARHSEVRRGGMTAPAPISRSRSGASASSGPSWATGRPPEVTTVRSPDPARRTASVRLLRRSLTPSVRSYGVVYTCVHKQI
jgi:hypothetical protein